MALTCVSPSEGVKCKEIVSDDEDEDNVASILDLLNLKVTKKGPSDSNYYCENCHESSLYLLERQNLQFELAHWKNKTKTGDQWIQTLLEQRDNFRSENTNLKSQLLKQDENFAGIKKKIKDQNSKHSKKCSELTKLNETLRRSNQTYSLELEKVGGQAKKLQQDNQAQAEMINVFRKKLELAQGKITEHQNHQHMLEFTVTSLRTKVAEWEQHSAAQQQEIARLNAVLVRENTEKQMLSAELAKRCNETERLINDLAIRNTEFQRLSANLGSGNSEGVGLVETLMHQNTVECLHKEISTWQQKLLEEQEKCENLNVCLANEKTTNEKLSEELNRKNAKIQSLAAEVIHENGANRKLAVDLAAKDNENQRLTTDLTWKNGEIERLTNEVLQANSEKQSLSDELTHKTNENERLSEELNREKEETQRLSANLEEEQGDKAAAIELWYKLSEFVKSCNQELEIQINSFTKDYHVNIPTDTDDIEEESEDDAEEEKKLQKNLNTLSVLIRHIIEEALLGNNETNEIEDERQFSISSQQCNSISPSSLLSIDSRRRRKRSYDFSSDDPCTDDNSEAADTTTAAGETECVLEEDVEDQVHYRYLPVCSPVSSEDTSQSAPDDL